MRRGCLVLRSLGGGGVVELKLLHHLEDSLGSASDGLYAPLELLDAVICGGGLGRGGAEVGFEHFSGARGAAR